MSRRRRYYRLARFAAGSGENREGNRSAPPLGFELLYGCECFRRDSAPLLWASNFSTGVNVFVEIVRRAGELMKANAEFDAHIVETHHTRKKDAPSGTAIAI